MLIRSALGHWLLEGDDYGVSRLVREASSFDYPVNLEALTAVAGLIPEGGTVVDAGASLGDQTVIYSQIVGASGHVYACEPQTESYAALVKNTARLNNVSTYRVALGAVPQVQAPFSVVPWNYGASFLGTDPQWATETVAVTTLDTLLADVPRLDFIHLDAEGMELHILRGAAGLIARFHPPLLVELTDRWLSRYGCSAVELVEQLRVWGYPTVHKIQSDPEWFDIVAVYEGVAVSA